MSFKDLSGHPIIKALGALAVVVSVVVACVSSYVFLRDLKRIQADFIQAKTILDTGWIKLDREDHDNLLHLGTAIRSDIKMLSIRLEGDSALIYQVGLRDGRSLCRSQKEEGHNGLESNQGR